MAVPAQAQEEKPERGSIIEDRAARKLLQAGDARLEVGENEKALEIWESVVERYPRSPIRFEAHIRLADHLLEEIRDFDKVRVHYDAASVEENPDDEQRAYAFLNTGACFYEGENYGKCFTIMRDVIEKFPTSPRVNEAYYYIGLGHFKLGHYSRAIDALEKVGTAVSTDDSKTEKIEAGKRLYIKIDDLDFAILPPDAKIEVTCTTTAAIPKPSPASYQPPPSPHGSVPTALGSPESGNGILEVRGGDTVTSPTPMRSPPEKTLTRNASAKSSSSETRSPASPMVRKTPPPRNLRRRPRHLIRHRNPRSNPPDLPPQDRR